MIAQDEERAGWPRYLVSITERYIGDVLAGFTLRESETAGER